MKKILLFIATIAFITSCSKEGNFDSSQSGGSGKGGSMARFTISDDVLYIVNDYQLKIFDISKPEDPVYLSARDQQLGFGIETIFPMDTLLFIGSKSGMYIYDIKRPAYPQQLSFTSHISSCDPVVAQGNYAYVTLNSASSWCGRTSNVLQVYDISDPKKPVQLNELLLNSPKGLGVDGNRLLVCDNGLKMYDITNPTYPKWISDLDDVPEIKNVDGYDVIMNEGNVMLIGADGFYQLKYSGDKLQFISKLEIKRN